MVNLTDCDGNVLPERLSLLEGKRVRFDVTHERRPGFDIAYRKVQNMRPIKDLDQAA